MGFDAFVELVKDGTQPEVAVEDAEAFFDAHEVDGVAPEFGGGFAREIAAQQILAFVATGGFEFVAIQLDAEGLAGGGKMEDEKPVGVAPSFLFGGTDGEQQVVAGEVVALLEFLEVSPVGFEFFAPHGAFLAAAVQAAGQHVQFAVAGVIFSNMLLESFCRRCCRASLRNRWAACGGCDDEGAYDEGADDLHAVWTLVAAVTESFEAAGLGDRAVGIDLEVGAG